MRREHWLLGLLAILAATSLLTGLWAEFAPHSFYSSFPTSNRHWVASAGPYDQHLVRDFGSLNLALATITIVAFVCQDIIVARAVAAGFLVFGGLHVAYHLERPLTSQANQVLQILALLLPVIAAGAILVLRWPPSPHDSPRLTRLSSRHPKEGPPEQTSRDRGSR